MSELGSKIEKRIGFLAERFGVFDDDDLAEILQAEPAEGVSYKEIFTRKQDQITGQETRNHLALIIETAKEKKDKIYFNYKVKVHEDVFVQMIAADPTPNKIYLQWMLDVFSKLIKDGDIDEAIRFGTEDLGQANEYLELFDGNKRKRLFSELAESNYALKGISDPTNINQYKHLGQVFDAVDPFVERIPSALERTMQSFVDAGHAEIPVRDRNFTLFVPLTRDANVVFDKFAGWCTAKPSNGMFDSYTNRKTPLNKKSKIYIIIKNEFFSWDMNSGQKIPNDMMYQLHFESSQLRDRSNGPNKRIYESVLSKSDALSNYFYDELMPLAKAKGSSANNSYIDYLIDFGHSNILFDMEDDNVTAIRHKDRTIPKLPDMSRFKNLDMMFLCDVGLHTIHESIGNLQELSILSMPKNKLTSLPKELGQCKKLVFMNIIGNKINEIPNEIANLDRTRGGSLFRVSVRKSDIGEENYRKLRELLPSVGFTEKET